MKTVGESRINATVLKALGTDFGGDCQEVRQVEEGFSWRKFVSVGRMCVQQCGGGFFLRG